MFTAISALRPHEIVVTGDLARERTHQMEPYMDRLADTDQKKRRDKFFCQLARRYLVDQDEKAGWLPVADVIGTAGYSDFEIKLFLKRLAEDGWIEVKDHADVTLANARLTSVGKARAQVMCKDASFS